MSQNAKPDFADYGITLGKIGNHCSDIINSAHSGKHCYVGDSNTLQAATHLLPANVQTVAFPAPPKADMATVETIRKETASADALIAVGSGTLNDLCKYASFLDNKPYSVIATAPSMNGYVSANASITVKGYKKTLSAHAPTATICDTDILASAPARLIHAGIGDTLCRTTIQADWLLSHLLLGTSYEAAYFDWLQESETLLLENPSNIEALMQAILLSGLAMRDYGSSAPASQSEHMIGHLMEMLRPDIPHPYHGEAMAVTSLSMAKRQEKLLGQPTAQIAYDAIPTSLPAHLHDEATTHYTRKLPNDQQVDTLNHKLQKEWPAIAEKILEIILPVEILENAFKAANCPIHPEEVGWDTPSYTQAMTLARFTRDRFTFLDIN